MIELYKKNNNYGWELITTIDPDTLGTGKEEQGYSSDSVQKIIVRGESIEYIYRNFNNIPFPIYFQYRTRIVFHDHLAKFIIANL